VHSIAWSFGHLLLHFRMLVDFVVIEYEVDIETGIDRLVNPVRNRWIAESSQVNLAFTVSSGTASARIGGRLSVAPTADVTVALTVSGVQKCTGQVLTSDEETALANEAASFPEALAGLESGAIDSVSGSAAEPFAETPKPPVCQLARADERLTGRQRCVQAIRQLERQLAVTGVSQD
jgi:hypothetical protein